MNNTGEVERVLGNLVYAVGMLEDCPEFVHLIPEVRVNLAYALPEARTPEEVAAVDGRITTVRGLPCAAGTPKLGASDHMARLIIEVRHYDATVNAGINFKCDEPIIEVVRDYCSEKRLLFGWIDRTKEPPEAAEKDKSSMPWKIKELVSSSGGVPRLFYEGEGWGKEPLFVALGRDAVEVSTIAIEIARRYREKMRA